MKAVLDRRELRLQPSLFFHLCSDAMYEPTRAGMGGFCHGAYWSFQVPDEHLPALSIPILEFLGVVFNFVAFAPAMRHMLAGNPNVTIVLRTDTLTAALTLPRESQRTPLLVSAYQWLRERAEFRELAARCFVVTHLFGDVNPFSDALSRGKWEGFQQLCSQVGVRPVETALPHAAYEIYEMSARAAQQVPPSIFRAGGFSDRRFPPNPSHPIAPDVLPAQARCLNFLQRRFGIEGSAPAPEPPALAPASVNPPPRGRLGEGCRKLPGTPTKRVRLVGGLHPPVTPPTRTSASALAQAGRHYARIRAQALAAGEGDMALRASVANLMDVGEAIQERVDYGANANTWQKDERAWLFWEEEVCRAQGTSPLRTAADFRASPERQAHLLAVLLLHAFSVCKPRNPTRAFINPRSALAYPLSIIRVFGRWGITMPGYTPLVAAMNGCMRQYVVYHGPHSLAPKRAEPMEFSMMRAIYIPSAATVGRWLWSDDTHDVFMFRRLNVFLMHTGFRLGETVAHTSGEVMFITRSCVVWCIGGVMLIDPTPVQLLAMRPGIDYALVVPPRSKPDQWREVHCPFPVTLTFGVEVTNPAAQLLDIELQHPCHGTERATRPLFADAAGGASSHGYLSPMLRAALTYLYGVAVAGLYNYHSYRSGLATALHAPARRTQGRLLAAAR